MTSFPPSQIMMICIRELTEKNVATTASINDYSSDLSPITRQTKQKKV